MYLFASLWLRTWYNACIIIFKLLLLFTCVCSLLIVTCSSFVCMLCHIVYHVIFSGPVLSDCTGCMYSLCSVWHCIYMAIFILLMFIIRYYCNKSNRQADQDTSSNLWGWQKIQCRRLSARRWFGDLTFVCGHPLPCKRFDWDYRLGVWLVTRRSGWNKWNTNNWGV